VTNSPTKLLLTGDPGCGKTTVLRRVVERLRKSVPMTGFLTDEVRVEGQRQGFRGTTIDGREFVLADREIAGELRVGPYGVDLEGLETIGLASLEPAADTRLIVLDEIGKMELLSPAFKHRVEELVEGDVALLATIALRGVGFVKRLRNDPRVTLLRMRRHTSDAVVGDVLRRLAAVGISRTAS
jgi:nucleoside-triphosphatase